MSTKKLPGIWNIVIWVAGLSGALVTAYTLVAWAGQGFRLSALDLTTIITLIVAVAVLYLAWRLQRRHGEEEPRRPFELPPVPDSTSQQVVAREGSTAREIKQVMGDLIEDDWVGVKIVYPASSLPGAPCQAPRPLGEFVGREEAVERLAEALVPGGAAAITGVVGMGGVGKTELAKVVAQQVAGRFGDGVLWADCGRLELEEIAGNWSVAFGVRQLPGDDLGAKAAAWRGLVSGREALLIFDDVQPGQEVEILFPSQGRSGVLITTRHSDHAALRGIEPVKVDVFTPGEAMALAERVLGQQAVHEQATAATRLFKLVGYLPLGMSIALHLARDCEWRLAYLNERLAAAAALEVLESAENLRKSLGATFETAWETLPLDLQWTFRALALFNAGPSFSTAALAETLALEEGEARARLRRLAGRSLLNRVDEGRWGLHTLLREFVATRSPVDEEAKVRMARYYVKVVGVAKDLYEQGDENILRGLALLDQEWPHIRAGQTWAAAHRAISKEAARLCSDYAGAAVHCLDLRLHGREWVAWLKAAVHSARKLRDRQAEGTHLGNMGNAYADLGEVREAIEYYEAALGIAREIGDRRGEGKSLGNLGVAYAALGEMREVIGYYEAAMDIAREIGDRHSEGNHLGNLGSAHYRLGEVREAIGYYEAALVIAREIGDRRGEGNQLGNLGVAYVALGEVREAIRYYEAALDIAREIGDRRGEGVHLGNLGVAHAALGEVRKAIGYYEAAMVIAREIGDRGGEGNHLGNLGLAYADLGEVKEAIGYYEAAMGIAREIGDRRGEGAHLGNLGNAYADLGEVREAIEYYEAALGIAREIGDRRGEGNHCWNLGLLYEGSDPARAVELMERRVAYEREIGHPDAGAHARRVAEIRARL